MNKVKMVKSIKSESGLMTAGDWVRIKFKSGDVDNNPTIQEKDAYIIKVGKVFLHLELGPMFEQDGDLLTPWGRVAIDLIEDIYPISKCWER